MKCQKCGCSWDEKFLLHGIELDKVWLLTCPDRNCTGVINAIGEAGDYTFVIHATRDKNIPKQRREEEE